jgi:hypothetical protein
MTDTMLYLCAVCRQQKPNARYLPGVGDICSPECLDVRNRPAPDVTFEQLRTSKLTFAQVQQMHRDGRCGTELWEAYCYAFRNDVYRYSDLGKSEARRHAERFTIALPYSDRAP